MPKTHYDIEGRRWLPISRAAALLGTNAAKVRELMGSGALDWRQTRANSRVLVVDEQAVMKLRSELPAERRRLDRSPDPLARMPRLAPERPLRNGPFLEHHLRLTLPRDERPDRRK